MPRLIGMAVFSPCSRYRYRLERMGLQPDTLEKRVPQPPPGLLKAEHWDEAARLVLSDWYQQNNQKTVTFCMLNGSTATGEETDPTITRCVGFATAWGYHRLVVVNAYGFTATQPDDLWRAHASGVDIVGPDNNAHIVQAVIDARASGGEIIAAWGKHAKPDRVAELRAMVGPHTWKCLGRNKDGSPVHPLYQPKDQVPSLWTGRAVS